MSPRPARVRLLAAAVVTTAALAVVGVVGLVRGHTPAPSAATPTASASATRARPDDSDTDRSALAADDGVQFARTVAETLFDWDTTDAGGPDRIVDLLIAVGDPSGQDVPGLAADLRAYLPTADQWAHLREYRTRQHLDIATAQVPESWLAILADPGNGLVHGTFAVTIDGTRVREGAWFGQTSVSRSPVAFTVFALCPPAVERGCRLLRLSGLDTPLR